MLLRVPLRSPGPNVCPNCGERVSSFAAGCSLCGAELDPRRADRPSGLRGRAGSAWRARPRLLPRLPLPERRRR
jgi:predicted amidophosphoribosyltransferase